MGREFVETSRILHVLTTGLLTVCCGKRSTCTAKIMMAYSCILLLISFRLFSRNIIVLKIPLADAYGGRNHDFGGGKLQERENQGCLATGSVNIFGLGDLNIHFKSILSTIWAPGVLVVMSFACMHDWSIDRCKAVMVISIFSVIPSLEDMSTGPPSVLIHASPALRIPALLFNAQMFSIFTLDLSPCLTWGRLASRSGFEE